MCWNQTATGLFVIIGIITSYAFYRRTKLMQFSMAINYFVLMELLQFFQFFWINDCNSSVNKFLTVLGYLHICFQPYICHFASSALAQTLEERVVWKFVRRLCLLCGGYMFMRWIFASDLSTVCNNSEWLTSSRTCTVWGNYHLAWEVQLLPNSYFVPSLNLHLVLMLAPLFVMSNYWGGGVFLLFSGPILSAIISKNVYEQPAIWCLYSIAQCILFAYYVYNHRKDNKLKQSD